MKEASGVVVSNGEAILLSAEHLGDNNGQFVTINRQPRIDYKLSEPVRMSVSQNTKQIQHADTISSNALNSDTAIRHLSTFKGTLVAPPAAATPAHSGHRRQHGSGTSDNNNNNNNAKSQTNPSATKATTAQTTAKSTPSERVASNAKLIDRNSLESIDSNFSISSSANDDSSQHNHLSTSRNSTPSGAAPLRYVSGSSAIIATHYVSPPRIRDEHLILSEGASGGPLGQPAEHRLSHAAGHRHGHAHSHLATAQSASFAPLGAAAALAADDKSSPGSAGERRHRSSVHSQLPAASDEHHCTSTPTTTSRSSLSGAGGALDDDVAITHSTPQPPFMFAGILASILCSLFFSISILCIKLLPNSDTAQQKTFAVCVRGLVMALLCGTSIFVQGSTFKVKRDELWVNILRAVFGYCGVLGAYFALSYISMGDSTALVFSSPVWTSLLGRLILKEPLQWIQLLALPASIFGIVLIAHPALILPIEHVPMEREPVLLIEPQPATSGAPTSAANATAGQLLMPMLAVSAPAPSSAFDFEHRWPGIAIALATSVLVSCVYIVLKFRKTTPIQTTTFWLGAFTFVASLVIMSAIGFGELPSTWHEYGLMVANGFFSWLGQSTLQWAFLYEEASILSVVRTLDVAMCFVLSAMFLDDEIYWTSIVGAIIIGLVVASIMLSSWVRTVAAKNQLAGASARSKRAHAPTNSIEAPVTDKSVEAGAAGKTHTLDLATGHSHQKSLSFPLKSASNYTSRTDA